MAGTQECVLVTPTKNCFLVFRRWFCCFLVGVAKTHSMYRSGIRNKLLSVLERSAIIALPEGSIGALNVILKLFELVFFLIKRYLT